MLVDPATVVTMAIPLLSDKVDHGTIYSPHNEA